MFLQILKSSLGYLDKYSTAIIAISTVIYMFVTWRIFNANKKSYLAKYMPIICIDYDRKDKKFKIQNIGNGLAINIDISSFRYFVNRSDMEFRLDFSQIHNLRSNEIKELPFTQKVNTEKIDGGPLDAHLYSEYGERDFIFTLIVKDILGNIYYEKINMGKSGIFVLKLFKAWWFSIFFVFLIDRIEEIIFNIKNRIGKWMFKQC